MGASPHDGRELRTRHTRVCAAQENKRRDVGRNRRDARLCTRSPYRRVANDDRKIARCIVAPNPKRLDEVLTRHLQSYGVDGRRRR